MARLKKQDVINELTKLGIPFSGDMSYNELYKLYKEKVDEFKNIELNAKYSYSPDKDDELLIDRPSKPLKEKVVVNFDPTIIKDDKLIYQEFINGDRNFIIFFKGNEVFSSKEIDIKNIKPLDEYFTVYGKKYPYRGASIKYI